VVIDVGKIEVDAGPDDSLVSKVDGCVGKLVRGDGSVWGCIEARFGGADTQ
jgi:hypothetical protein